MADPIAALPAAAEPEPRARTLGFDVLLTAGGKAIFLLCGALMTVLIARRLGPGGQGTFAVAFSLTLLLVQTGNLGLPIAMPYFSAREPEARRVLMRHALVLGLVVGAVLAATTALVVLVAPNVLRGLDAAELAATLSVLPVALMTLYLQGILLGEQRMVAYNLVDISQVASALAALAVLFAVTDASLLAVLWIVAAGRCVSLVVALVALRRTARSPAGRRPRILRELLGRGARVYVVGLLTFALIRVDLLFVNALLGSEDAGHYSIATYVAEALIFVPIVVATNLIPRVAKGEGNDLVVSMVRVVGPIWGLLCALSAPVVLAIIPLVFGDRFNEAVALYLWLLPGTFAMGVLNALVTHYMVRGYPAWLMGSWVVALGANVVLNVVLLPRAGVVAAPILSSAAYGGVLIAHLHALASEAGGLGALRPSPRDGVRLVRAAFGRA